MKALILAAGLGTRLAPITDDYPKCMTEVADGKTIIEKQIDNLLACGINDINIVSGYKSDLLKKFVNSRYDAINFIESVNYRETNNMYSAFLGKSRLYGEAFIMMNADVFFDESVLRELMRNTYTSAIVTDVGTYNEESMKVIGSNGKIIKISKGITQAEALGCSIDIYKFSCESGKLFFDKCYEYINQQNEKTLWSEVALDDILEQVNFTVCPLSGRWFEIDNHDDLAAAVKLFS